ncbi:hypothetical protein TNCV_1865841 [Trichonephila clavipes]|nr:hypothetical protein TNCV_1865841 [Trichonephila clavipes]
MASAECMGVPWAPTSHKYSAGCSIYQQCILKGCGSEIQYHDTGCRTSVEMHNATVQQPLTSVYLNSNLTIVMLQAEAGYVSKHISFHSIGHVHGSLHHWRHKHLWFPVRSIRSNGRLTDILKIDSAANIIESYERTTNDMWLRGPLLPCAQSACHHRQWRNDVGAIGPSGPSFSPASSNDRSASQLLDFIQHIDRFL